MAVEKYKGKFSVEPGGCTTVINETVNAIRNGDAAALYLYLICRPPGWDLCVKQLMAHYGWGQNKTYKAMSYLQDINLLKKIGHRDKGKFIKHEYILMLRPYREIEPLVKNSEVAEVIAGKDSSPLDDLPHLVHPQVVKRETYKTKINTKQRDYKNIPINPTVLSSKSTEKEFDSFWNLYPSKKAKKKCLEIWKRRKLGMMAEEIFSKLKIQIAEDDQWIRGFIPNPTTYLNQDRWDDDISIPKPDLKKDELLKKQLESSARMAEQERLSRIEHEQQIARHQDYNKDGKAYREIAKAVKRGDKSIPAGLKDLKRAAGVK